MAISRYDQRQIITNVSNNFSDHFEKRGVNFIKHYTTLNVPIDSYEKSKNLILEYHVWALGDRLSKLSEIHYGDPKLWWVIGLFNMTPTDSHVKIGQTIIIPKPLQKFIDNFGI